ncbi:MAG TPA: hypothetical protein VN737_05280 [Bryobacteraceae bacterium]|nr:hypothetical protein [Bryobacteraceae bacterium]
MREINAKDGVFAAWEKKRIEVIETILHAEPDLRKILVNLDAQQRKEKEDLIAKQRREPSPAFGQLLADMEPRHDKERERRIREHRNAKSILGSFNEQSREQTLEQEPDQNLKRSR